MMRKLLLTCLLGGLTIMLAGQHNYIFNGGAGMGFVANGGASTGHNPIFGGAADDGWDADQFITPLHHGIFAGGQKDGFDAAFHGTMTLSGIFAGGHNDGFDQDGASTEDHHAIWGSGTNDGFAANQASTDINSLVYAGGSDDGFDQSGISGTIWTGAVNKDWLIAGNWLGDVVPTVSHHALIPRDAPRFPVLYGLMLIGEPGYHKYTARSVRIAFGASIHGLLESEIINKGVLRVDGLLDLR